MGEELERTRGLLWEEAARRVELEVLVATGTQNCRTCLNDTPGGCTKLGLADGTWTSTVSDWCGTIEFDDNDMPPKLTTPCPGWEQP